MKAGQFSKAPRKPRALLVASALIVAIDKLIDCDQDLLRDGLFTKVSAEKTFP
jgi:hypothetical protein